MSRIVIAICIHVYIYVCYMLCMCGMYGVSFVKGLSHLCSWSCCWPGCMSVGQKWKGKVIKKNSVHFQIPVTAVAHHLLRVPLQLSWWPSLRSFFASCAAVVCAWSLGSLTSDTCATYLLPLQQASSPWFLSTPFVALQLLLLHQRAPACASCRFAYRHCEQLLPSFLRDCMRL